MRAKISALNKNFLVEFKSEQEFIDFTTKHNDKIKNIEIINEEGLPQLQKPVELAKPSKSDGWKALEKSAFVTKEKGVDKKCMELGGKYTEFKYEPDKTLASQCDDKVSKPKNDSPALKGEEPKVKDVEATAKENEVEVKDAPKAETTSEPKKEETSEPKTEDKGEDKPEEKKEEPKEEDDEKKEVKESVEGGATLTPEEIEEVKSYFMDICADEGHYPDVEEMKEAMRSLDSFGSISNDQYNYCLEHWDEWLNEYEVSAGNAVKIEEKVDNALNDVMSSAGVELEEGIKDYLPRTGFIRDDDEDKDSRKVGAYLAQGTDDQLRKAKIIAKVKFMNGDRFGRVSKEDLEHFDEYKAQYDEYFGEEVDESADGVGIERNPHKGDDLISYAKSTTWTPGEEVDESANENKTLKEVIKDFIDGKCSLDCVKKFMKDNNLDPSSEEIKKLISDEEKKSGINIPVEEGTKEGFKGEYADTDSEVEANAENKPSEEFKAELEKHGKLKGDGTDKLDESNSSLDKAYEEAYEVWNNAGSNDDELYKVCSDVSEKFGVRADDLYNKIKEAEANVDAQDPDVPSGNVKVKVYDIEWDCDGADPDECGLPDELELEINHDADFSLDDEISDELTKSTGFCHYGFKYDLV